MAIASVARNSGGRSRSVASDIALYSGFAATGVGCALPGALLPNLAGCLREEVKDISWLIP